MPWSVADSPKPVMTTLLLFLFLLNDIAVPTAIDAAPASIAPLKKFSSGYEIS